MPHPDDPNFAAWARIPVYQRPIGGPSPLYSTKTAYENLVEDIHKSMEKREEETRNMLNERAKALYKSSSVPLENGGDTHIHQWDNKEGYTVTTRLPGLPDWMDQADHQHFNNNGDPINTWNSGKTIWPTDED